MTISQLKFISSTVGGHLECFQFWLHLWILLLRSILLLNIWKCSVGYVLWMKLLDHRVSVLERVSSSASSPALDLPLFLAWSFWWVCVFCEVPVCLLPNFLLSCMSFLIVCGSPFSILDTSRLSDICIVNLFPFCDLLFHSLLVFWEIGLYIIQFIRFPFVFSAFWVMLKNICLLQGHKDDDLCFVL